MINVIINGARGRMGQCAQAYLAQQTDIRVVATGNRGDDITDLIKQHHAEVVVELTTPEVVFDNAFAIIAAGARPVIGATGLTPDQIATLEVACARQKLGGIIAPNFSVGAILMMRFAAQAARYLPHVEIIESHHDQKQDAPSGTADKTAKMLREAREQANLSVPVDNTVIEQYLGARGGNCEGIRIHSVRLPGFLAKQEVIFGSTGETLSICHNSIDRQAFMPGIALSCRKVMALSELVYGLESLLL